MANKYGWVLPTYLYSDARQGIAEQSYASLARTEVPFEDRPLPLFVVSANDFSSQVFWNVMGGVESVAKAVFLQPSEVNGLDPSIAWMMDKFFDTIDCTHVVELADDMLYNPRWFIELKALVSRHPEARAWSVYRSSNTRHHRTRLQDGEDHSVTSLAGNGSCWTREEWKAWDIHWQHGPTWPVPSGGDTLDLHHAYFRPGDRWATDKSYMMHAAGGIHAPAGVECAMNFVGEE